MAEEISGNIVENVTESWYDKIRYNNDIDKAFQTARQNN